LNRFLGAGFCIPDAHASIEGARDEHGVVCAAEADAVYAGAVAFGAAEALDGFGGRDVPEEDAAVAANGGEAGVVSAA